MTKDGISQCSSQPSAWPVVISVPVVLVFEVQKNTTADDGAQGGTWDFPDKLYPLGRAAEDKGLVYKLVGRGLVKRSELGASHFISRHSLKGHLYSYDDLMGGQVLRETGQKRKGFLRGKDYESNLPDGFKTWAVIYHLKGGLEAQKLIHTHQLTRASAVHHLRFSTEDLGCTPDISLDIPGTTRMPDAERSWLTNPYSTKTIDYRSNKPPVPKQPAVKLNKSRKRTAIALAKPSITPAVTSPSISPPDIIKLKERIGNRKAKKLYEEIDSAGEESAEKGGIQELEPAIPPSSPFHFTCRCGLKGEGSLLDLDQEIVECGECHVWSHLACQKDGRASGLLRSESFSCDSCLGYRLITHSQKRSGCAQLTLSVKYQPEVRLPQQTSNTADKKINARSNLVSQCLPTRGLL